MIETYWMNADYMQRAWILRNCGWSERSIGPMSRKSWEQLSPAARNVLLRKDREGVLI